MLEWYEYCGYIFILILYCKKGQYCSSLAWRHTVTLEDQQLQYQLQLCRIVWSSFLIYFNCRHCLSFGLSSHLFFMFWYFYFFPESYWYNIGIKCDSVSSTSVILVCAGCGTLIWRGRPVFSRIVRGSSTVVHSWSSSLGYFGQLLKASVWLADRTSAIIKG